MENTYNYCRCCYTDSRFAVAVILYDDLQEFQSLYFKVIIATIHNVFILPCRRVLLYETGKQMLDSTAVTLVE
jgi:hypothetical protein